MQEKLKTIRENVRGMVGDALKVRDARTSEERRADGEKMRENTPIESHAAWEAPANRPDPVALLKAQGVSRVQALLPLRYKRMSVSAFTFYRGGALIMASDLSNTPSTGIKVQACGDAHISNFGFFNSPERRTVFDINDFDETSIGPWEWDIKRLAASVEICGRDRGFSKKEKKAAVLASVKGYREAMQAFAKMGHQDVWYAHVDVDDLLLSFSDQLSKKEKKAADKIMRKAKRKNSARAITKLTEVKDGKLRIVSIPPSVIPMRDLIEDAGTVGIYDIIGVERIVKQALAGYRKTLATNTRKLVEQYRGVDIGVKVVGVGSVGTRALIVVMEGADRNDPLVLQIKEAQESVLERFCGKSRFDQHGKRVVEGQHAMQTVSDSLLGWCRLIGEDGKPKDYYVRQLWDGKGSIDLDLIGAKSLKFLAEVCGATLAHAHARTGDRFEIAGYLGDDDAFDKAILQFARAYADQNEADYSRFMEALESGELDVE